MPAAHPQSGSENVQVHTERANVANCFVKASKEIHLLFRTMSGIIYTIVL